MCAQTWWTRVGQLAPIVCKCNVWLAHRIFALPTVVDVSYTVLWFLYTANIKLLGSTTTRIALLCSDILVLTVTWRKTLTEYLASRKVGMQAPVTTCLIRDGQSKPHL